MKEIYKIVNNCNNCAQAEIIAMDSTDIPAEVFHSICTLPFMQSSNRTNAAETQPSSSSSGIRASILPSILSSPSSGSSYKKTQTMPSSCLAMSPKPSK